MARFILSFLSVFVLSLPAAAAETGIKVGEKIPGHLEAMTQSSEMVNFDDLAGEKGATLVFYRSADWCPYCQQQLIELNKRADEFGQAGYPLVGISYDGVQELDQFAAKRRIKYTLLSDRDSKIIKAFGILNEDNEPDSFAYGVPHPSIYVVGLDETVKAKYQEDGYKDRPNIDDILSDIKKPGHY